MIPLGVEASTATAAAVDGVAPMGFLDGLLAALNAGTSTTVELGQMVQLGTAPAITSSPDSTPIVAAVQPPVNGDAPAPQPALDPAEASVWSVTGPPGERETLHTALVESFEAPRSAGNTPQDRRGEELGEDAATAPGRVAPTPLAHAPLAPTPFAQGLIAQAPVAQAPVVEAPVVQAPVAQALVAHASVAQDGAAHDPIAPATPAPAAQTDVTNAARSKVVQPAVALAVANEAATERTTSVAPAIVATSEVVTAEPRPIKQGATDAEVDSAPRAESVALHADRPVHQPESDEMQRVQRDPAVSATAFAPVDAGVRRDRRQGDAVSTGGGSLAVVDTSIVTDRSEPTPALATGTPPVPKAMTAAMPASAPRSATPLSLGMIGVDRVRFAREQAPSRAVQRLAIDLDGAQIALRFRGDRVAVDVLNDPSGTLGNGWARQVERNLDQAVRTVVEPQRGGQASDQHQSQTGDSGRRSATAQDGNDERQRRSTRAFELFPEEED